MRTENVEVVHNRESHRFELTADGHLAVLNYRLRGDVIIFTHTGVPPAIGGRGLGSQLVKTGLEHARAHGLKVRSLCWFVSKYIRRHPEYQNLTKR